MPSNATNPSTGPHNQLENNHDHGHTLQHDIDNTPNRHSPPHSQDTSTPTPESSSARPKAQRKSSSTSNVSASLSEASSSHSQHSRHGHHHRHHKARGHVVGGGGHGRLGARNLSHGKNLNLLGHHSNAKLTSLNTHAIANANMVSNDNPANINRNHAAATGSLNNHQRSRSGDHTGGEASASASSPRPSQQVKRNSSAFVIARNHSQTALRKNHSSGHLPRNHSSKALNKPQRQSSTTAAAILHAAPPATKGTRSGRVDRSEPASPAHPTVRFALGDDVEEPEHDEDNWTEESASASPHVTRDSTRQNSVILDTDLTANMTRGQQPEPSQVEFTKMLPHMNAHKSITLLENGKRNTNITPKETDSEGSYHPARPPDADVLTSRLLQRAQATPQVSPVSVTSTADPHNVRSLGHSQGSTLGSGSTPGRDLVSRFVNASSVDGTPRESNLLPRKDTPQLDESTMALSKRNTSAPNLADRGPVSPTAAQTRRSNRAGTTTSNELPPSRTQQKLLLQRASSTIEPQKHIPAVLPRPGATQLLGHGLSFSAGASGLPAQVLGLFAQINKEYQVVRRYRSPVADAMQRQKEATPPEPRPILRPRPRRVDENGVPLDDETPVGSFRSRDEVDLAVTQHAVQWSEQRHHQEGRHSKHGHHKEGRAHEVRREERGHKSRVSFDLPNAKADDTDEEESPKRSGERTRPSMGERDEAYEICRRMWEMAESSIEG